MRQLCSVSYQLLHMSHTQRICKYGCSWGYQIVGNSPFTGKAFAWWVANHKTWVPFKIKLRFYGTRGHLKVEHCFIHHCPLKPDPMVTQLGNWVSSELANDYNIVMFSLNQNMKVECKQQWSLELGGTFHNCRILQEHTWWFGMPILKSHRYFLLCVGTWILACCWKGTLWVCLLQMEAAYSQLWKALKRCVVYTHWTLLFCVHSFCALSFQVFRNVSLWKCWPRSTYRL